MEKNAHRLISPTLLGRTWQHLRMMLLTTMLAAMTGQTARAQEGTRTLTVYDGTTTNEEIPAYFNYFNWFARSQFVIPEYKLDDMTGGTISSLTFYTTSNNVPYTTTCSADVYLMEVDYTAMTALEPKASGTTVYHGILNIVAASGGGTMTITLTTPYTYGGGNLLIGIENTAKGGRINIDFYGQTVNAAAWSGVDESSLDTVTGYQQNFIPKTTFIFTPGSNPIYYRPTDPTLADVDATTATLSWTVPSDDVTEYAYQYKPTGTEAWSTEATVNATTTTATLSDLTAGTTYDFRVKALYNGGESKYATLRFTTIAIAPVAVSDSWSDDFEGNACSWLLVNGDCTNAWAWGTAASRSGTHALYVSNDGGTTNAYTVGSAAMVYAAKPLTFTDGEYEFNYDWRCDGVGGCDFLRVALVPATELPEASQGMPEGFGKSKLPSGWIALDGGSQLNQTPDWQSKSTTVSDLAAGNYYLVFAWRNDDDFGDQPPAAVDNVGIRHWSCTAKVNDLAVGQTDCTSATLSWTGGEATQWQVAYSTSSDFAQATEVIVDHNPNLSAQICTLTGLPTNSYYARVRSYCGGTDYGKWSDAVTFAIDANPVPTDVTVTTGTSKATLSWTAYGDSYNVRYKNKGLFQGFENDLSGWTTMNCVSSTGIYETVRVDNATRYAYRSGKYGFAFAASNNNQSLISPELSITEGMKLEFYYRTAISNQIKKFRVGFKYSTSDTDDFAWQNVVTVTSSEWNPYIIDIPEGTKYICIQQIDDYNYNYYLLIDDISVYQTDWTTATATEKSITLTGLAPETTYEYQVQSVKDEAASAWTELTTFTTSVVTIPSDLTVVESTSTTATLSWTGNGDSYNVKYSGADGQYVNVVLSQDFENGLNGWTRRNCGQYSNVDTYSKHTGSYGFRFSSINIYSPQYLISPELPDVTGNAKLEFYYMNNDPNRVETFQIGYSTTTNDTDQFTFGDVITASDMQWHHYSAAIPAGTKYICWKLLSNDKGNLFIDDISVASESKTITATENTITITGLTPGSDYAYQVQSVDDGAATDWSEIATFSTKRHLTGDANSDGYVTIDDVIAVVNYILGNTPDKFDEANADVDTNIGITITDAVTIVNMVLTQQEPEPDTE